ncbi:MAG: hypothetical protein P8X39_12505, partial [Desulfofustis sp.]
LEQRLRVENITADHPIRILAEADLAPERLARIMKSHLQRRRYETSIDLAGAEKCVVIMENL